MTYGADGLGDGLACSSLAGIPLVGSSGGSGTAARAQQNSRMVVFQQSVWTAPSCLHAHPNSMGSVKGGLYASLGRKDLLHTLVPYLPALWRQQTASTLHSILPYHRLFATQSNISSPRQRPALPMTRFVLAFVAVRLQCAIVRTVTKTGELQPK